MTCRPKNFRMNYGVGHPFLKGLVFFGGGRLPGTDVYHDSSPLRNNGVLTNMDPPSDWVFSPELGRWAIEYDEGVNACINCGSNLNIVGTITLAAWIKAAASEVGYVIARGDPYPDPGRYNLYWGGDTDTVQWWSGYTTTSSSAVFVDTTWVHAVVTMNVAGALAWYRNGIAAGTANAIALISNTNLTWLGKRHSGTTAAHFFAGQTADSLIYNRALSLSEISAFADPSNIDLRIGGVPLILPPARVLHPVAVVGAFCGPLVNGGLVNTGLVNGGLVA